MALGGGNFVKQNKVLPGSYINFVSAAQANIAVSYTHLDVYKRQVLITARTWLRELPEHIRSLELKRQL